MNDTNDTNDNNLKNVTLQFPSNCGSYSYV